MCGGITGMGANGHFQRHFCLVILPLAGVHHSQVVIRFRQFGIVFGEGGEYGDSVSGFALFGEYQPL